ncbi:MAG TPA: PEP-CTERM sorting domain-containing protein [Roseiarcus sp.]|nr:PEP-CTERM sorting domain-containing protein [Roseiarcus sp.]
MIFKMLAAAMALAATTASARASVTQILFIQASDFALQSGSAGEPPPEPVTAGLIITFDPSQAIFATTSGLTVSAFNLPFATKYAYSAILDTLVIGTDPSPAACGTDAGTWCAIVAQGSQAQPLLKNVFVSANDGGQWVAQKLFLNVGVASPVPEPSTWVLSLLGFGGLASALICGRPAAARAGATV